MAKQKQPPGPPMTLGNMRALRVQRLIASCLNDACRHTALIDVSSYPAETDVPYFARKVMCAKCGSKGNKIDVRPNWSFVPSRLWIMRSRQAGLGYCDRGSHRTANNQQQIPKHQNINAVQVRCDGLPCSQ
jgi:hypothetical protein